MILKKTPDALSTIKYEGDQFKIFHAERIPTIFFEVNQELQKRPGLKWADDYKEFAHVARVPTLTYFQWRRHYPELRCGDPDIESKFLMKLLDKEENKPFKLFAGRCS